VKPTAQFFTVVAKKQLELSSPKASLFAAGLRIWF
jgi:hypothetical protein